MAAEDPIVLLGRLRLGREEYCQRLLTMLILGGAYPRWNTRNRPSPRGTAFLADLYATAYPGQPPAQVEVFVDEFDLPPRTDAEKGGAPDWAVLWADRLWMIELKTERASHREDQLPHYMDLARHHHPGSVIDLTYLTPRMASPVLELHDNESFAHLAWDDVAPLIQSHWGDASPREQAVASVLLEVLDIQQSWPEWREARLTTLTVPTEVAPIEAMDCLGLALALAAETAADGQQRGVDCSVSGVEELHRLRVQVRDELRARPGADPVRVVRPWVWSATTSGGNPLTKAGVDTGYELRVSRYATDPRVKIPNPWGPTVTEVTSASTIPTPPQGAAMNKDPYLFNRRDWTEFDDLDEVSLATDVFFQMWQKRADPYNPLKDGDLVYIGDTRSRKVHWEVRVSNLLTGFQYRTRRHALAALRVAYGMYAENLNDYHRTRPEPGWLLAWSPIVMRSLDLTLPPGMKFGQNGYRALPAADQAAIGLPKPRSRSATPLASPPPWYDPTAAATGTPRVVPRYIPLHVRLAVWARDGGRCVGCGRKDDLHLDHIKPYSFGGPATVENLRVVCARSNLVKGAGDAGKPLECQTEGRG